VLPAWLPAWGMDGRTYERIPIAFLGAGATASDLTLLEWDRDDIACSGSNDAVVMLADSMSDWTESDEMNNRAEDPLDI